MAKFLGIDLRNSRKVNQYRNCGYYIREGEMNLLFDSDNETSLHILVYMYIHIYDAKIVCH